MTVFTETFTRADGGGLAGLDLTWSVTEGAFTIFNNAALPDATTAGSAICAARAEHDVGHEDMYVSAIMESVLDPDDYQGLRLRGNASNETCYSLEIGAFGGGDIGIYRYDASGVYADDIGFASITLPSSPFTIAFQVQGSDLRGYINGALVVSGTAGTLLTGQRGGITSYLAGGHPASNIRHLSFEMGALSDLPGGDEDITPSTVIIATALPTPSLTASASVTPSTVVVAAGLPVAAPTASASITPSTVAVAVEVPQPSVTASAGVAASVVMVAAELPAAALVADVPISPDPVAVAVELPTPGLTSSASIEATSILVVIELPGAAVDTESSGVIEPDPVAIGIELPPVSLVADASVEAATVGIAVDLPATSVSETIEISPAAIGVAVELPTTSPSTTASTELTSVVVGVELPQPSVSTTSDGTVSASPIVVSLELPQATGDVVQAVTPSTVPIATILPTPTITADAQIAAAAVTIAILLLTPSLLGADERRPQGRRRRISSAAPVRITRPRRTISPRSCDCWW